LQQVNIVSSVLISAYNAFSKKIKQGEDFDSLFETTKAINLAVKSLGDLHKIETTRGQNIDDKEREAEIREDKVFYDLLNAKIKSENE
jgi:hypothetical protein